MLPCQVSRRRRHLDSDLGWRWRSSSAGLKGFAHPQQGFCRQACPLDLCQINPPLLGQTTRCWHDLGLPAQHCATTQRALGHEPQCQRALRQRPSHLLPWSSDNGQHRADGHRGPLRYEDVGHHPEAMDSSSVAILAVSSSTRGSPSCTGSPSCFSHLTTVASCISMPHWGKTISWAICFSFTDPPLLYSSVVLTALAMVSAVGYTRDSRAGLKGIWTLAVPRR